MAKKYISKYTGPEIDSGLDNIPKLEGKLTELESNTETIRDFKQIVTPITAGSGTNTLPIHILKGLEYSITNNGDTIYPILIYKEKDGQYLGSIQKGATKIFKAESNADAIRYYKVSASHTLEVVQLTDVHDTIDSIEENLTQKTESLETIENVVNVNTVDILNIKKSTEQYSDLLVTRIQTTHPVTSGSATIPVSLYKGCTYLFSQNKYTGTWISLMNGEEVVKLINLNTEYIYQAESDIDGIKAYWNGSDHIVSIENITTNQIIEDLESELTNVGRNIIATHPVIANNVLKKFVFVGGLRIILNGKIQEIAPSGYELNYGWKASNSSNVCLTYNVDKGTFYFKYSWDSYVDDILIFNFFANGSSDDNTCNVLGILHSQIDIRIDNSQNNGRYFGYYYGEKIDVRQHKFSVHELFRLDSFNGNIANLSEISTQGFDIYENRYLFQASHISAEDNGIIVADLNNNQILGSFQSNLGVECHYNNLNCGRKYNSADKFPLIYFSDNTYLGRCIVARITDDANSMSIVQTIVYRGTSHFNGELDINWAVDDKYIYGYKVVLNGESSRDSETEIVRWKLPYLTSEEITLNDEDVIDSFVYKGLRANQGAKVVNDKFYSPNGLYTDTYPSILQVINLQSKKIVSELNLSFVGEPEGIAFMDDVLVINQASDISAKYFAVSV